MMSALPCMMKGDGACLVSSFSVKHRVDGGVINLKDFNQAILNKVIGELFQQIYLLHEAYLSSSIYEEFPMKQKKEKKKRPPICREILLSGGVLIVIRIHD